ncbi:MAG: acetyl-CoA carboxylase biotin carboxyl carrier protein [Tissierellaceae bacterium]|nr:acetyl-CoA carboxylase biotin carboxyl carrier protein [Tissierellia bacterium]
MDIKDIKDLIVTINNTDIETVEIKKSDIQVLITKSKSQENHMVKPDDSIKERVVKEEKENLPLEDEDIFLVESPMVGTYYGAPSPDADPFVKVGDRVEKGQTLCIIEAMKIMNEIESEISGEIVEILANDEDIVEYGQALMKIRR